MSSHRFRSLIAIAFSLLSTLPPLTNAKCDEPTFSSVNATGSTTFPGFHPNGSVPGFQDSNWTLHTDLVNIVNPSDNSSFIIQNYWLDTDPIITTPAAEFPFTGCTFLLTFPYTQKLGPVSTDSNTCEHIFNDACQSAIIETINSNITSFGNASDENLCNTLLENSVVTAPPECKDSAWGYITSDRE
jgi:hypothetical protein